MARITFEVTTRAVQADLWVRARGRDPQRLDLDDGGKARADLPEGGYDLFWTISGPPGCAIAVVARQAGEAVLDIADAIPRGRLRAAGAESFSVRSREALRAFRSPEAEVAAFADALRSVRREGVTPVTAKPAVARLGSDRSFAAAQ